MPLSHSTLPCQVPETHHFPIDILHNPPPNHTLQFPPLLPQPPATTSCHNLLILILHCLRIRLDGLIRVRVLAVPCFLSRLMYIRLCQCIHVAVRQIGGAPEGGPVGAVVVGRAGLAFRIKPASVLENVVTGPVFQI